MTKLDYSFQTPDDRKELVEKILDEAPDPSEQYLESLADYLILCMEKQERKEKKILTDNRMVRLIREKPLLKVLFPNLKMAKMVYML